MTYKIILYKNALIHLARLIDNPDNFADNLMTSIFRLKFNSANLVPSALFPGFGGGAGKGNMRKCKE